MTRLDVLRLANLYAAHRGIALSSVGLYAGGDGKLFARLQSGGDLTTGRAGRIVQWFSDHWPGDMPWPAGIDRPRPAPNPEAAA